MANFLTNFKALPNSLTDQVSVATEAIEAVLNGEVDPIRLDIYLKSIEDTIKMIRKNTQVKEKTISEAMNYGKQFDLYNANVAISSRRTYAYEEDGTWAKLKIQETEIADQRKIREKLLKNIPDGSELADTETGEMLSNHLVTHNHFLKIVFNKEKSNG